MKRIIKLIKEKEFLRFFLMFLSGTLLGQIITVSISPLLTRIYTPEEYGLYGVYLSIVSLLIVFVTGRYEFAINNSENEGDALSLYKIVCYLSVFSSGVFFILILFFGESISKSLGLNISKTLLFHIPLTLLIIGFLQGSTYYLNRQKDFQTLSKSKIYQSIGNGLFSITLGLAQLGALGLVIGNIIGLFTISYYQSIKGVRKIKHRIFKEDILRNFKKYKNYPLYNAPSAFFDSLAIQAPVFILLNFFSNSVVGYYSLTVRVIGLPLGLISTSISQVFLSQISELHRNNISYKSVILKLSRYLAFIGLIPLIPLLFWGPSLFSWVFGKEWSIAGEYAQVLTIGYYFKFVVVPLSMVFFINKEVKLLSILQTTRAFSTLIVLILFSLSSDLKLVLYAYTVHEVIFYIIYFFYILKTSK